MKLAKQYQGVYSGLKQYWAAYGGAKAMIASPFLHAALVLTLLCSPLWWRGAWWEKSLGIVPSVLGFSIAGFALLLGVGNDKFRVLIGVRRNGRHSTLTNTSAGFLHFILIQILALAFALIASARPLSTILQELNGQWLANPPALVIFASKSFRGAGFFFLSYSLTTAAAATLSIFRLATVFSVFATRTTQHTQAPNEQKE